MDCPRYVYTKLGAEASEIRFLSLLPGQVRETLRISIFHASLVTATAPCDPRVSRKELAETLPPGWAAHQSIDGRFIFEHEASDDTSWVHPDRTVDRALYDGFALEDVPEAGSEFEALSYTWGSTEDTDTVEVVDRSASVSASSTSRRLSITRNLSIALRAWRLADGSRTLWVDAICINQQDIRERDRQVLLMRYIYKLAKRVIVWLGPSADNGGFALQTLRYLGAQVVLSDNLFLLRAPEATEQNYFRRRSPLPYDARVSNALIALLRSPWFKRLWVIQEIQLANRHAFCQCGEDMILWIQLFQALTCLINKMQQYGAGYGVEVAAAPANIWSSASLTALFFFFFFFLEASDMIYTRSLRLFCSGSNTASNRQHRR